MPDTDAAGAASRGERLTAALVSPFAAVDRKDQTFTVSTPSAERPSPDTTVYEDYGLEVIVIDVLGPAARHVAGQWARLEVVRQGARAVLPRTGDGGPRVA